MAKKTAKRILVTGASGFIGQALVAAAVRAGYVVRVAIRRDVSFAPSVEVKFIPDLRDKIEWDPILQDVDLVVHAAGLAHADLTDNAFGQFDKINWLATASLAAAVKVANIKRFVYISSVRAQVGPSASAHNPRKRFRRADRLLRPLQTGGRNSDQGRKHILHHIAAGRRLRTARERKYSDVGARCGIANSTSIQEFPSSTFSYCARQSHRCDCFCA